MILINKTKSPLRVRWNDVTYTDLNGSSGGVVHESGDGAVASGATLLELLQPASHRPSAPLIAFTHGQSERQVRSQMARGTIKVSLPIEIDGTAYRYVFHFAVKGNVVRVGWSS